MTSTFLFVVGCLKHFVIGFLFYPRNSNHSSSKPHSLFSIMDITIYTFVPAPVPLLRDVDVHRVSLPSWERPPSTPPHYRIPAASIYVPRSRMTTPLTRRDAERRTKMTHLSPWRLFVNVAQRGRQMWLTCLEGDINLNRDPWPVTRARH